MNTAIDIQRIVPAWQALQSAFPLSHIESAEEYQQATDLLNTLLDVVRDDRAHPLYSLVSIVGDIIEAYEIDHEPSVHG